MTTSPAIDELLNEAATAAMAISKLPCELT